MYTGALGTRTLDLVRLDMDTGIATVTTGPQGKPFNSGFQFHPTNGLMYYGTAQGGGVPNILCSYNFATGATDQFAFMPQNPNNGYYDEPGFCICSDESPSRVLYGSGDGGSGILCAWNPVTRVQQNYGILDDPGAPYARYLNSFHGDANYAYVSIADSWNSKHYLCIVNFATGVVTVKWKTAGYSWVDIVRGVSGPPYAIYANPQINGVSQGYYLLNGTADPVYHGEINTWDVMNLHRYLPRPLMDGYTEDSSLSNTGMYSSDPADTHIQLGYGTPSHPATVFVAAQLSALDNYSVMRLALDLDDNLLVHGPSYAPTVKYDRTTGVVTNLGQPGMSAYATYADKRRGKIYIGGYAKGSFAVYDPAQPWVPYVNPLPRPFTSEAHVAAKYIYDLERMVDNSIWAGGNYTRSDYDGELIRYDPDANIDTNIENDRITLYAFQNMASNLARSMMVVSGSLALDGTVSKLFVFQVNRQNDASMGHHGLVKIIDCPAGGPWRVVSIETGVADINRFICIQESNSPHKAFCINIATEQIIWTQASLPGQSVFVQGIRPEFAYGYVWYIVGSNLKKMDPATGAITNVTVSGTPVTVSDVNPNEGLLWDKTNKILYYWDAYTLDLYRVEGIDGI